MKAVACVKVGLYKFIYCFINTVLFSNYRESRVRMLSHSIHYDEVIIKMNNTNTVNLSGSKFV